MEPHSLFGSIGQTLAEASDPIIHALLIAAAAMAGFYWARSLSVWFFMRVMRGYHEREEVYLNGVSAIITKMGFLSTTFLILNGSKGDEPVIRWACVSNSELDKQRIERISLKPSKLGHHHYHYDKERKKK